MSITLGRTKGGSADSSVSAPDPVNQRPDPMYAIAKVNSVTLLRWNGGDFTAGHNDTLVKGNYADAKQAGTLNAAAVTRVDH